MYAEQYLELWSFKCAEFKASIKKKSSIGIDSQQNPSAKYKYKIIQTVLDVAGLKVLFFTVVAMRLWFGFLLYIGLITELFLLFVFAEQCLHRAEAFSAFCIARLAGRWGMHGKLGGRS